MTLFTDHCHGRPLRVTQSWKIAGSGRLNVQKADQKSPIWTKPQAGVITQGCSFGRDPVVILL